MRKWPFYVYELIDADGTVQYVGKGSGRRLAAQRRNHSLDGREVARFEREEDAYAFERERIAEAKPPRNRHPGGNGSRVTPEPIPAFVREIERVGARRYAARFLLTKVDGRWPASKVERIRQVANGPRR